MDTMIEESGRTDNMLSGTDDDSAHRHNFTEAIEAQDIIESLAAIQHLLSVVDSDVDGEESPLLKKGIQTEGRDEKLNSQVLLNEAKMKTRRFMTIIDGYLESSHMLDGRLESIATSLLQIVLRCGSWLHTAKCSEPLHNKDIAHINDNSDNKEQRSFSLNAGNIPGKLTGQNTGIVTRVFLNYIFQCLNVLIKVRGYKVVVNFFTHDVADLQIAIRLLRVYGTEEQTLLSIAMSLGQECLLTTHKGSEAAGIMISAFLTRAGALPKEKSDMMVWVESSIRGIVNGPTQANSAHQAISILRMLAVILRLGTREEAVQHFTPTVFAVTDLCRSCPELMRQHLVHKLLIKMECRAHLAHLKPRVRSGKFENGNRLPISEGASEQVSEQGEDQVPERVEDFISTTFEELNHPSTGVRYAAAKAIARLAERLPTLEMVHDVCGGVLDTFSESLSDTLWQGGCLTLAELAMRGVMDENHMSQLIDVLCRCLAYDRVIGTKPVGAAVRDAACYLAWALARAYSADCLRPYLHELSNSLILVMCFDREVNCRKAASAAFQEHVGRQGTFKNGISIVTNADYFAVGNRHNSFCVVAPYIAQFEEYRLRLLGHLFNEKLVHWDQKIREVSAAAVRNLAAYDLEYLLIDALPALIDRCGLSNDMGKRHGCLLGLASTMPALRAIVDAECTKECGETAAPNRVDGLLSRIGNLVKVLSMPQVSSGRVSNVNLRVATCTLLVCICSNGIPIPDRTVVTTTDVQVSMAEAIVRICSSNAAHPTEKVQMSAAETFGAWCGSLCNQFDQYSTKTDTVGSTQSHQARDAYLSQANENRRHRCLARLTIGSYLEHLATFSIGDKAVDMSDSSTHRWGYLRLLGSVPRGLLLKDQQCVDAECDGVKCEPRSLSTEAINCLHRHSSKLYDVTTRVVALNSTESICRQIGFDFETDRTEHSAGVASTDTDHKGFDTRIAIMLCDILSLALSDTTIDHRGDVGSDVRSAGISLACTVIPLMASADLAVCKTQTSAGSEEAEIASPKTQVLSAEHCGNIIGLLLEQAMSRIDRLREKAGQVLSQIVWCDEPTLDCIPHLSSLREILGSDGVKKEFNWGSLQETLPALLHTLTIPDYRPYAIRALVLCIGAGNESTVCVAQDALDSYCLTSTANELCDIVEAVCSSFSPGGTDSSRLTRPGLETLSCLLSTAVPILTAAAIGREQQTFDTVLNSLKHHMKTTNVKKLTAVSNALCQLIPVKSIQKQVLKLLSVLLGHRFDHVRVMAVDQLNLALLTYEDDLDMPVDEALCLLDELRYVPTAC
ncbi:hypothetical protein SARC_01667 [Sphaeroforma arctica JP610]|uniref:Uncharacterized protein n=1 Tax=Sphaeroforma arctica JP610 TaxID=667725 RepID=A0A0L0GB14_9EUKA|nr:hypothetical protein SARC_01667 [Sphaeroforma arctica JP610]KNC86190.1 hypothetical protein SARC_01667 [Sphaeroforma arctica JP610]|eukprot:XP_014160092.1 hypothetical protein SARC_01667 [Sphaeroforma arctica JP610]